MISTLTENITTIAATLTTTNATTTNATMLAAAAKASTTTTFHSVVVWLWLVGGPIVFVVGICGNIFVLLVMTKRHMGTSTCIHLTTMAASDLLVMLVGTIPEWFEYCFRKKFKEIDPITCKLEKFLFYTSCDVSILVLVFFTIDRYIAVCHPLRRKSVCTVSRARLLICITFILIATKNLNVFWTRGQDYKNPSKKCGITDFKYEEFEKKIRAWMVFATVHAPPAIIIVFCNSFIIKALYSLNQKIPNNSFQLQMSRSLASVTTIPIISQGGARAGSKDSSPRLLRNVLLGVKPKQKSYSCEDFPEKMLKEKSPYLKRKTLSNLSPHINRKQSEFQKVPLVLNAPAINNRALVQMTAMCLSASISFLVFYTPTLVFYIGRDWWEKEHWYDGVKKLNVFFIYVHHSINFILYCIAGQRFRNVFVDFFKNLKSRKNVKTIPARRYSDWNDFSKINSTPPTERFKKVCLQNISEDRVSSFVPMNGGYRNEKLHQKIEPIPPQK